MIRKIVDFSLNNRFIILVLGVLLFGWGAISFHNLPVEAYPDVANNYVEIITQWPGISAEHLSKVFERFYRIDESRTVRHMDNEMGAGLGLSLVAAVAQAHGGRLELDEGPGKVGAFGPGLRVALVLPRAA